MRAPCDDGGRSSSSSSRSSGERWLGTRRRAEEDSLGDGLGGRTAEDVADGDGLVAAGVAEESLEVGAAGVAGEEVEDGLEEAIARMAFAEPHAVGRLLRAPARFLGVGVGRVRLEDGGSVRRGVIFVGAEEGRIDGGPVPRPAARVAAHHDAPRSSTRAPVEPVAGVVDGADLAVVDDAQVGEVGDESRDEVRPDGRHLAVLVGREAREDRDARVHDEGADARRGVRRVDERREIAIHALVVKSLQVGRRVDDAESALHRDVVERVGQCGAALAHQSGRAHERGAEAAGAGDAVARAAAVEVARGVAVPRGDGGGGAELYR
mmetsp:Transcript_8538/g.35163  ORF Transcript_8538/g.35163 Transcript_8538/m.35163 type:complete len:322 (-) Transcript_8538:286-1251(-)